MDLKKVLKKLRQAMVESGAFKEVRADDTDAIVCADGTTLPLDAFCSWLDRSEQARALLDLCGLGWDHYTNHQESLVALVQQQRSGPYSETYPDPSGRVGMRNKLDIGVFRVCCPSLPDAGYFPVRLSQCFSGMIQVIPEDEGLRKKYTTILVRVQHVHPKDSARVMALLDQVKQFGDDLVNDEGENVDAI